MHTGPKDGTKPVPTSSESQTLIGDFCISQTSHSLRRIFISFKQEFKTLDIPWLAQRLSSSENLGFLDDIDFAVMLEELEFK